MKTEPKKFKANNETSLYGFKAGLSQIATETGLSHKDFSSKEGNSFKSQSTIAMCVMRNLFVIESNIHNENGTVSRDSKGFFMFKEAKEEFNSLKKKYKLKIVDQTQENKTILAS